MIRTEIGRNGRPAAERTGPEKKTKNKDKQEFRNQEKREFRNQEKQRFRNQENGIPDCGKYEKSSQAKVCELFLFVYAQPAGSIKISRKEKIKKTRQATDEPV